MPQISVQFLGAAETVTGSKFLLESEDFHFLVDCGLFQGEKYLRELNWEGPNINIKELDFIVLTHGHLDHVGYLPRLVRDGFSGKIYGTAPTLDITRIILLDSAKIQEEEAEKANEEKYSKHHPAVPLYSVEDAENTFHLFEEIELEKWTSPVPSVTFQYRYNGHILGATFIEMDIHGKRFVFSGDIGRFEDILLSAPEKPASADYLFLESTYGDRLHPDEDVEQRLSDIITDVIQQRGVLIIPSFAVERAQGLLLLLFRMYKKNKIPNIPVIIDSPMGEKVLDVFNRYPQWHKISSEELQAMIHHVRIVSSYRETWEIIDMTQPRIVVAGSGMITGGRVLSYLDQMIDRENTTVLLVGFQAEKTRGRDLQEGIREIKFFGKYHPVKAKIESFSLLSAHADQAELLEWLSAMKNRPEKVFLIHGENSALEALKVKLKDEKNWNAVIPKLNDHIVLNL
ncbi:MBL fold metallo-hydrolase RNA specificity domain-containing protein [Robertkochia solimangrovi]|uniref:MBL fold metallo-hydrolase RNA specificity domain-containing protein n=1 Tax=Robertkochia solimangrovi TaxID=2213046 RepID=UPI00117D44BC|nr:MBL fold metallo-hydrolase [Robertkochia solimangrovi]TRZ41996.1 MBL fold metallo-hydrolase [Robertkochia solimangrovi]